MVELRDIHKRFGRLHVLKGITLNVQRGEAVVIIGPSGSGKSTLLRCVNHLEQPDSGEVLVDGNHMGLRPGERATRAALEARLDQMRQEVGIVFQRFNLFPHMTAIENVMEGLLTVKRAPRAMARGMAIQMLDRVGLADKVDVHPSRLSGGQQQRVAIARSLVMQPKVMLFDEVTSALDPELIGEVLEVMRDLARSGQTMLIVTHEMDFARSAASRVVFLDGGTIVEEATPDRMFSRPQTERASQFLRKILDR
jgi:ABC-type polar amino acid transport system ATPase subunit